MFAHHEAVGLQVVHRVVKFIDLRSCHVAAAYQLVLLTAHDDASVSLRQEAERLRENEFKRTVQNSVQHACPGASRIFLEAQHAGKATFCLMPDFDRFPTYDHAIRVNCRGDATFSKWHTLTSSAHDLVQHLARFGEEHVFFFV